MAFDEGHIRYMTRQFMEPYETKRSEPVETAEEREKRLMSYELEKRENYRIEHQNKMEHDRQEQDYRLAILARQCVAWVVGVGIVAIATLGSILGGIYLSK